MQPHASLSPRRILACVSLPCSPEKYCFQFISMSLKLLAICMCCTGLGESTGWITALVSFTGQEAEKIPEIRAGDLFTLLWERGKVILKCFLWSLKK